MPVVSTITLGILLFLYVVFNDYVAFELLTVLQNLFNTGLISNNWLTAGNSIEALMNSIPEMIDFLFLISFLEFSLLSVYWSYKSNRRGYFDTFSYLTIGVMILLFILSIIKIVAEYVYGIFFDIILSNLTVELNFFNFYINNMFLVTLTLIVLFVVANNINLNLFKFKQKKQTDLMSDEI